MKKSYLFSVTLTVVLSSISMLSNAAIISYSDRSTWQIASGGGSSDILDNLDSGSGGGGFIDRGTYTSTGTAQNAFPNGNGTTTIDGTGYIRYLLNSTTFGTLTFDDPIFSLGFDINPHSGSLGALVSVDIDGLALTSYMLPGTDVNGFVGFISDTAFTTFTITSLTDAWHGVDNLEAFSAAASPVPVPAALWLFGSGLLGLVGVARRRKAA